METYNLRKLLESHIDYKFRDSFDYEDFKHAFENHEKISKPDFIAVLDFKKADPVIFHKNYNLVFEEDKKGTIQEIINTIDPNQINNLLEVDKRIFKFVESNVLTTKFSVFQLRFTASLIKNRPRTYLRNISFINIKRKDIYHSLLFVSISDITEFSGLKKYPILNIRCSKFDDDVLNKKIIKFKTELNILLRPEIRITKREQEILKLLYLGKTSEQISEKLKISAKTVNTHRQNLIKKFNVSNTASLINLIG